MGSQKIYSNAPLALTVVELRHTTAPPLTEAELLTLKKQLSEVFPLARPAAAGLNVTVDSGVPAAQQLFNPRFMTRDNTAAVTYRQDAIVVETTAYKRRSALRELLRQAVDARQSVAKADGITRLGLRYINEVRADIENSGDWTRWISPALTSVSGLHINDDSLTQAWQGLVVFGDQQNGVVLRHGNLDGYAVAPDGDLRRVTVPPGPFYLLDLDSFWEPADENPTLDWSNIEPHYDAAALSAYGLFEQLITNEYREEVLREHHEH